MGGTRQNEIRLKTTLSRDRTTVSVSNFSALGLVENFEDAQARIESLAYVPRTLHSEVFT